MLINDSLSLFQGRETLFEPISSARQPISFTISFTLPENAGFPVLTKATG